MKKTACFTGHRVLSENAKQLFTRLYPVLEKLVTEQGITDFYAGGAVGFDTIAAKCVLRLRDALNGKAEVRLHLVLPCSNEEQTKNWTAEQKYEFRCILQRADSVEYTAQKHDPHCMGRRNAKLVEHATDYCVCYYDIQHKSGTAQTVNLAKQKGLQIINYYIKNVRRTDREDGTMGLEKAIEHGKEHRKPYRGLAAYDTWCRNHGGL